MKKLLVLVIFATVYSSVAFAQTDRVTNDTSNTARKNLHRGHEDKREMMKNLNLNKEQMQAMKTAQQEAKAKMNTLKAEENITVKEMKERAKAIQEEKLAKLKAILTPEQFAKLKESMKEKRGNRKNKEGMGTDVKL